MYRGPGSAMPCVLSFDYLRLAGHRNRVRAYTDSSPTCKKNVSYFLILFFFCFFCFFFLLFILLLLLFSRLFVTYLLAWLPPLRVGDLNSGFFFSCFGMALTSVRYTACQRI